MRRVLIAVGLLAVVAASCGSGDGGEVAAIVNDEEITAEDVTGLLYDTTVEPNASQFAGYLGLLVQWKVVEQKAADEFGIVPSPDEIDAEIQQVLADFPFTGTLAEFLEQQNVSEVAMRTYAAQLLIEAEVEDRLASSVPDATDEEAQQAIDGDPKAWTEVCASHLLVATEDEANDAIARVNEGEAFADVAAEVSLDTGSGANGGDLGCASPGGYVPEFGDATMTAPLGEMVGPVETQFGFHVIVVASRTAATVEDVKQRLTDGAVAEALGAWFDDALTAASIEIIPEYGTWVAEPVPQVVPPG